MQETFQPLDNERLRLGLEGGVHLVVIGEVGCGVVGDRQLRPIIQNPGWKKNVKLKECNQERKVGGKRYEARSRRRSSPDSLAF